MKELFPIMSSKPEKIRIIAIIPAWLWVFILFPMFLPFVGLGAWDQHEVSIWIEITYHIMNGILMLLIIGDYLKEEWFYVSTDPKYYLKQVALTVGLVLGVELVLLIILSAFGVNVINMLEMLPIAEMSVSRTPLFMIHYKPLFGAITLTVFAPISICALFYCLGFAPICCRNPWLAYLSVAAITFIPAVIDILWRGEAGLALSGYLVRLPAHLLICWSYQRTDNVWTPLVSLAIVNLIMSIVLPFITL